MDLLLKTLHESDVTPAYVNWLSDPEVVKYSDNQFLRFTFDGQVAYVSNCKESSDIELFGIFDSTLHIGNISLRGLSSWHRRADVTYVIGERDYWGKGVATFAISEVIKEAKRRFHLNKLTAGTASTNVGSSRALERNGFRLEGIRKNHLYYGEGYHDQHDYGLFL